MHKIKAINKASDIYYYIHVIYTYFGLYHVVQVVCFVHRYVPVACFRWCHSLVAGSGGTWYIPFLMISVC